MRLLLSFFLIFRSIIYILAIPERVRVYKLERDFVLSFNFSDNLSRFYMIQISLWLMHLSNSKMYQTLYSNKWLRPPTIWMELLIKSVVRTEFIIKKILKKDYRTLDSILYNKQLLNFYIISIWSILAIRIIHGDIGFLRMFAVYAMLYSFITFVITLYIFFFILDKKNEEYKHLLYIFLCFPAWIFISRCVFVILLYIY